jgi:hypothetical protein
MDAVVQVENGAGEDALADRTGSPDFGFLPENLSAQCRSLIEGYHDLHGYSCLPDIL